MLKKLGLIALSSLLVLPAISSADTNSFDFSKVGSSYSPSSFSTDGGVLGNINLGSCDGYNKCAFAISQSSSQICYVLYATSSNSIQINTCNDLELDNGEYGITSWGGQGIFDTVSFDVVGQSIPVDPETPETPDVLGSFGNTLQGLVGNLVSSFSGILPTLILIGFGVLMLFVFWGYIKHASSELFTMNKNGRKSLSWYQNEDINAMYKDRRSDFVKNHDLNNAVSERYYNASARQDIFEKDYYNNRDKYYYDELVHNGDHFFRSNKETGEEEELFTDGKWYKTGGNFKTGVVGKRFNVD